jgi:hypothetical protein
VLNVLSDHNRTAHQKFRQPEDSTWQRIPLSQRGAIDIWGGYFFGVNSYP